MKNIPLKTMTMTMAVVFGGAPLWCAAAAGPRVGEERTWTLDFRTRLEQPGASRPVAIELHGDLSSTISAVRPNGEYDAALQVTNLQIGSTGERSAASKAQSEQLAGRLQRGFWATYRENGEMVAVHFFRDMDPRDRNLLQMIATECQYVRGDAGANDWAANERDGGGQYQANYHVEGPGRVVKQRVKYLGAAGNSGGVHMEIEQSRSRFTLDASGGVAGLDGTIRVRVQGSGTSQLAIITAIELTNLRTKEESSAVGSLAQALSEVESSPVKTQRPDAAQMRARLDAQLLDGQDAGWLIGAAFLQKTEDPALTERLAALFRQRPEAAEAALEALRQKGANRRITDALGSAGSPAAIRALASLAGDRNLPRALRIDALTAFITIQDPSVEAMRTPVPLCADSDALVASAARLASGALAHAGRKAHPDDSAAIDAFLVAGFEKAQMNATDAADFLSAMGNSGGASVAPAIGRGVHDSRAVVRVAAVRALRLIQGGEVDGLLARTIEADPESTVRVAGIFAAGFLQEIGPGVAVALVRAAKTDSAVQVRTGAITLLRQHPAVVPGVADVLHWVAQNDPTPTVRHLANEAAMAIGKAPVKL